MSKIFQQKCPKCLVLVDQRLHAKCPSDGLYQPYQWVLDPERWYLWIRMGGRKITIWRE